jgi:3-methylcrotonyl-CoA carboxylase alpha subunit
VPWQLWVASGEPLPRTQDQLKINGHAFEARIYAEDPEHDFLPATGILSLLQPPAENTHVRVDTGVIQGDQVSIYYDPMIAKLVVWDTDREQALKRLTVALSDYRIGGLTTNLAFLYNLATSQAFRNGDVDTGFIEQHEAEIFRQRSEDINYAAPFARQAILAARKQRARQQAEQSSEPHSPWHLANSWRANSNGQPTLAVKIGAQEITVEAQSTELESTGLESTELEPSIKVVADAEGFNLFTEHGVFHCSEVKPDLGLQDNHAQGNLTAPMNGTVVTLLVENGATVNKGETLMVMEAMKMEHAIIAPANGRVTEFFYQAGELVDGGAELLSFAESEENQ